MACSFIQRDTERPDRYDLYKGKRFVIYHVEPDGLKIDFHRRYHIGGRNEELTPKPKAAWNR